MELERRLERAAQRDLWAIEAEHRDEPAEQRFRDRQLAAGELIRTLPWPAWMGWEVWTVSTYRGVDLRTIARTWTRDEVLQAYYYLRLRDLCDPR